MYKFKVLKKLSNAGLPVIKTSKNEYQEATQSVDNWHILKFQGDTDANRWHKKFLKDSKFSACFHIEFQDMCIEEVVELGELLVKTYKPYLTNKVKSGKRVKLTKQLKKVVQKNGRTKV